MFVSYCRYVGEASNNHALYFLIDIGQGDVQVRSIQYWRRYNWGEMRFRMAQLLLNKRVKQVLPCKNPAHSEAMQLPSPQVLYIA